MSNPFDPHSEYAMSLIAIEGGFFTHESCSIGISSFYMDMFEITQGNYEDIMGVNPSFFNGSGNLPVEQVSWFNAIEFCNRRSMKEGLSPCYSYSDYGTNPDDWPLHWDEWHDNNTLFECNWQADGYRLPTEMEWMYAAKGGNLDRGFSYSGSDDIDAVAWYTSNSEAHTHPVGELMPNELSLFDMSGNVWEWCWDFWSDYPWNDAFDPHGPNHSLWNKRLIRGGSWYNQDDGCTVWVRVPGPSDLKDSLVGFRCVRVGDRGQRMTNELRS